MDLPIPLLLFSSLATSLANRQLDYDYQEQMMDEQNEYNLPINQVNRLKAAGISPASLAMGNGLQVAGNTSATPNAMQLPQIIDPLLSASNAMLAQSQAFESTQKGISDMSLREYRIEQTKLQNDKYLEEIGLLQLDSRAQQIANDYAESLNEIAIMQGTLNLNRTEAQIREIDKNVEQMDAYILQKLPAEVQEIISRKNINVLEQDKVVAEISRIYSERNLNVAKMYTEDAMQQQLMTQAEENHEKARSLNGQIQFFLDTYEDALAKFRSESNLTEKEARLYVASKIFDALRSLAGGAGIAGNVVVNATK